jgi:hypothetical protein
VALDKQKLIQDLLDLQKLPPPKPFDPRPAAEALADAIDAFVRSGDVTGITVHRDAPERLDSVQTGPPGRIG